MKQAEKKQAEGEPSNYRPLIPGKTEQRGGGDVYSIKARTRTSKETKNEVHRKVKNAPNSCFQERRALRGIETGRRPEKK